MLKTIDGIRCVCKYGMEIPEIDLFNATIRGYRFIWQYRTLYAIAWTDNGLDIIKMRKSYPDEIPHTKKGRYVFSRDGE